MKRTVVFAFVATCVMLSDVPRAHAQAQDTAASCSVLLHGGDAGRLTRDIARMLDLLAPESSSSFTRNRSGDRYPVRVCGAPASLERPARRLHVDSVPTHGFVTLPADLRVLNHSEYPRGWNDGVLWGGVGLSLAVSTGAMVRWGPFEAALAPVFTMEQNEGYSFERSPDENYSAYIHRWHGRFIDLPQLPGNGARTGVDAGHSYVRVHAGGLRAGLSSENILWGPARRNALLLSGTAGGFPHAFVETAAGRDIYIGSLDAQLFLGRLDESEQFDFDPDNDHRALTGLTATLRPRGIEGLFIGGGYLHSQTWGEDASAGDVVLGPWTGLDPDSVGFARDLRLLSLFLRWTAAPGGLEVYGEWARQDRLRDWFRLLNPVEQSQAYTLGLQKIVRHGGNAIRIAAEVTHLADALPNRDFGRGISTFYVSPNVPQGHTHDGQLLGAPIGPGSESQFLGIDMLWRAGLTGLSIERVRYDDDAYYAAWYNIHGPHGHDTELSFRLRHLMVLSTFALDAELGFSVRHDRSFIGLEHVNYPGYPYRRDENIALRITGRWNPFTFSWTR